jgi:hypothetical protein
MKRQQNTIEITDARRSRKPRRSWRSIQRTPTSLHASRLRWQENGTSTRVSFFIRQCLMKRTLAPMQASRHLKVYVRHGCQASRQDVQGAARLSSSSLRVLSCAKTRDEREGSRGSDLARSSGVMVPYLVYCTRLNIFIQT